MILVAPDKFKGTLTAESVCCCAAEVFGRDSVIRCPMADGGEGTAHILASHLPGLVNPFHQGSIRESSVDFVVDSHDLIGPQCVVAEGKTVVTADSSALGLHVAHLLSSTHGKVYVGVGGTGTCDAGLGFLTAITRHHSREEIASRVVGLIDVSAPLLAPDGEPSALMFAPQKGATDADMPLLRKRLEHALTLTSQRSPFDGAGGGLGFALASVLGCRCHPGARFVLDSYHIDWSAVDLVITGEGCLDAQTAQGKVVDTVCRAARAHGKPCIVVAGCVAPDVTPLLASQTYACDALLPHLPLNHDTALQRLRLVFEQIKNNITTSNYDYYT